jgi:hypothetical protein
MIAEEVRAQLKNGVPSGHLSVLFFDRTMGETEGNYYICGEKKNFESNTQFLAKALNELAGDLGCGEGAFVNLEINFWELAARMPRYVKPGEFLCFPPIEILGFIPPEGVERKYFVEPNFFDGTEECFFCETNDEYILLYWYTTG